MIWHMTPSSTASNIPEGFGLPPWAWPLIGLGAGIALVIVVHGTCFLKEDC